MITVIIVKKVKIASWLISPVIIFVRTGGLTGRLVHVFGGYM